ncbi:ATP-dependent Lon protease [Cytobacillus depressus]|uniref:ATP-dependent Lon protease n=1 Tax=Cytobacillus depressus TaxID=1602942 RepID=A0A6L3V072_9BACI|nr:ATP-dependent Lon protease [Cytobacillus depressus]KAB2328993.1 ATP-dependent Lon protease [Cytobacillus depressus]
MKLLLSIILAGLLGILIFFGPIGVYILCAIIVGVIFRSFVLLNEIHKQVISVGGIDRAKEAYERYLKESEKETNEKR